MHTTFYVVKYLTISYEFRLRKDAHKKQTRWSVTGTGDVTHL